MRPPVIGLPTYHPWVRGAPDALALEIRASYCQAVAGAGGAPLLVPLIEDEAALLDRLYGLLDGLLLCGGGDVAAGFYGAEDGGKLTIVDPSRDRFELGLTRRALADGLPVLAICRGIQLLNVALGGTLVQDIPTECPGGDICHATPRSLPPSHIAHTVTVAPGSLLALAMGLADPSDPPDPSPSPLPEYGARELPPEVPVNSRHHQAVARVASGYVVSALAPDGVIEGIEPADRAAGWVVGVQWHPENMVPADAANRRRSSANRRRSSAMTRLFRSFVDACRR